MKMMMATRGIILLPALLFSSFAVSSAFVTRSWGATKIPSPAKSWERNYYFDDERTAGRTSIPSSTSSSSSSVGTALRMGLDAVTYLRTEWVSAALCTNQTPRAADVCLQIGTEDGRAVTFIPRTIRELITSSAEPDGKLTMSVRRQLKTQQERRDAATVTYVDQPADDLRETADESVDVVISLQAAARMTDNGLDWKRSVREAARVLKPGGRLLFVEQTELNGESYLEYLENLSSWKDEDQGEDDGDDGKEKFAVFDDVGWDDVDLVLQPHRAGVAIKSMDAGMTPEERSAKQAAEEKERLAEISIAAFERGIKKRKRKKKKGKKGQDGEEAAAQS